VHYMLRRKTADGLNASVYAKISVNGCAREISMHYVVKVENWQAVKGLAKPTSPELQQMNLELEEQRAKIFACYREIKNSGDLLTADAVKARYLGYDKLAPKRTLRMLMEEYEKDQRRDLAPGSWKNYHTTYKYLREFLAHHVPSKDLLLTKINHNFLFDFRNYIREHPTFRRKPANQNGLAKHVERIKRMIEWSREREWISSNPVEAFKTPKKKVNRSFLEEDELKTIEQCRIDDPQIEYVQDLFIFSCYTGITYSDLINLTDESLVQSTDKTSWITGHRVKTNTRYIVPLLPKPLAILKKYKNARVRGRLFHYISNQEINRILKLVRILCHIHGNLSFHIARHTFATIVTLANGVPLESVSSMLGHTKITTTQIYAKIVAAKVKSDMFELQKKLKGSE
jgi:integrase/recombinase XerD